MIVELKVDRRFKPGNIKQTGNVLRGHPDTIILKHMEVNNLHLSLMLNPPLIVSDALADKLVDMGFA